MESLASEEQYADVIDFVAPVSSADLGEMLSEFGIGLSLLQPVGQYPITTSTKLFEYMSQALAIVASDLPGTRVCIEPAGCGVLVPATDAAKYVEAIVELVDDPERALEMGRRGRTEFEETYNWEAVSAVALVDLYRDLQDERVSRSWPQGPVGQQESNASRCG